MAEDGLRLGFALGLAPEYPGSDKVLAAPFPSFGYTRGKLDIESNGLGVQVNLAPVFAASEAFSFGPILRYDLGRNDVTRVEDAVVRRLAKVRGSVEVGAFVAAAVPVGASVLTAKFSVVRGLDGGHEGLVAEAALGVVRQAGDWTFGAGLAATAVSGDYADAYFGVTAADAARSGLAAYDPAGGIRDAGVTVFASYAVSERLSVDAIAGYSRLVGDAAQSPLVKERGSAGQPLVAVGATWRLR